MVIFEFKTICPFTTGVSRGIAYITYDPNGNPTSNSSENPV